MARIAKRARLKDLCVIFVHTHPGGQLPHFSHIDDRGEAALADFFARRDHSGPHASIVLSKGGMAARLLATREAVRVVSIGDQRRVECDTDASEALIGEAFDRQIRAFGADGQRNLQSLKVAIVGLGGTGSIAAQQLVHLGVQDFLLIDPDHLEDTNLNRVVGAFQHDIGAAKVKVAARYLQQFNPKVSAQCLIGDVVYASVARTLCDADIILCCTDSHGSRSVVQQVAYQYLIPCIDMGSTIATHSGEVTGIFGRVQLIGPDQPCLWCSQLLNSEQVRRDMMNTFERQADPYIIGAHEPAPSVISLNGTVVSLAMTMFLGLVTSIPAAARHIIYNAKTASLRTARASVKDDCFICSRAGVVGRGDAQALFARHD